MMTIILLLVSTVIWQEDFSEGASVMRQLYDYRIDITQQDNGVRLTANPQFEGFASAWLYVDKDIHFHDDDVLEIRIRDNGNAVRIRYFFLKENCPEYYAGENIVFVGAEWQNVEIPLRFATPFFGSEFPAALTPNEKPALYLFIENAVSGSFDVELDHISVTRRRTQEEEQ
ncbi:MAG: hypothetical protein PVH23_05105 [candidate division WOR-3 bacterium]|jgi:hypothetical protein